MSRPVPPAVRPERVRVPPAGPSAPEHPRGHVRDRGRARGLAAVALVAACGLVPSAAAAAPALVDRVAQPFAPQALAPGDAAAGAPARTATGGGRTAWVVREPGPGGPTAAVWTLRRGVPVRVVGLSLARRALGGVELGVDRGGAGVLVVETWGANGTGELRLVNLDDGSARRVSRTRHGLAVGAMAVDRGWLYYVAHAPRFGPRNRSSLWRARVKGTTVGPATKLRSSRRGQRWNDVDADVGLVAVSADGPPERGLGSQFHGRDEIVFGPPRGRWAEAAVTYDTDYGSWPYAVLGFTRDRRALVVGQDEEDDVLRVYRRPRHPRRGERQPRPLKLGATPETALVAPSYDARTGRLVAFGPDASGAPVVGRTAPVLRR